MVNSRNSAGLIENKALIKSVLFYHKALRILRPVLKVRLGEGSK